MGAIGVAPQRTYLAASLAVFAAQVSFNLGAALGKRLFETVGPEGVAALRNLFAAAILVAAARLWRVRLTRRQAGWLVLYGVTLGGMNLLIYWAIERIPLGLAIAIEVAGPLAVVLLTSRSLAHFGWFALAVAGIALLLPWPGSTAGLDPLGIAFALGAATCWALYIVIGKRAAEVGGAVAVACGMLVASLVTVPVGLAVAGANLFLAPVIALGLVVAVLSSALPYFVEMKALERLDIRLFGLVSSSAPAIAALIGFVVLGERLTLIQWGAVMAMIIASAGSSLTAQPRAVPAIQV